MDLGVVCKSHDQVAQIIMNRTIEQTLRNLPPQQSTDAVGVSVLGVLVGLLTALLVTLLLTCTAVIRRYKLRNKQHTTQ